jgi:hypothetical protein
LAAWSGLPAGEACLVVNRGSASEQLAEERAVPDHGQPQLLGVGRALRLKLLLAFVEPVGEGLYDLADEPLGMLDCLPRVVNERALQLGPPEPQAVRVLGAEQLPVIGGLGSALGRLTRATLKSWRSNARTTLMPETDGSGGIRPPQ